MISFFANRFRLVSVIAGALLGLALVAGSGSASAHTLSDFVEQTTVASLAVGGPLSGQSGGCRRVGNFATGLMTWHVVDGDKRTRSFLMQVPAEYESSKSYALVFVFHGAGGSSSQSYSWGLQGVAGASEAAIFVYPDGIPYENYGVGWDDTANGYDMVFFDNMVSEIEADRCINKSRLFVAGFSWGGDFATALVCSRGNSIRAAAVNSTTDEFKESTNFLSYKGMPCPATIHPAVRFEHAVNGDSQYPAPDFANTSKLLQHLNSCAVTSTKVSSSTTAMTCASFNSCKSEYVECAFESSIGHALPPNWAKDTWAFFNTF